MYRCLFSLISCKPDNHNIPNHNHDSWTKDVPPEGNNEDSLEEKDIYEHIYENDEDSLEEKVEFVDFNLMPDTLEDNTNIIDNNSYPTDDEVYENNINERITA